MNFKEDILRYYPVNEQEKKDKEIILQYIEQFPDTILKRENEFAHLTSSGFILNEKLDKVLMIYHNIYDSWGWTGGHADGEKDLLKVAVKEAKEETGIMQVKPLYSEVGSIDILPVWGHYKEGKYVSSHMHLSVAYLLIAKETEKLSIKPDENSGVRWIEIKRIKEYVKEAKMLPVYHKLLKRIV